MAFAQIALLTTKLASLNATRATLVDASASTTEVDVSIADTTNLITTFNEQLSREQALAQNNINALSIKNNLITNLGNGYRNIVMSSMVCTTIHDNCPCMSCKYAYYAGKGLTAEQIKLLI